MNIKKLNEKLDHILANEINEEAVLVDSPLSTETTFKYVILPHDVPAREIHDSYPEVIFTGEFKKTIDDAKEYITYFKKKGNLYALRLGYENNWFIGGWIYLDESFVS